MTQPFTYRIRFIPTGEYYYGVRFAKNCSPVDLWTKYFTSSKKVKSLIKKYGKDSFNCEIRKIFNNPIDAILWEHRVNSRTKNWSNYLNKSDAKHQGSKYSSTGGLVSKEQKVGLHNPNKPWLNSPTKIENMRNGHLKGGHKTGSMPWWNNGVKDTKSIECPGEGWSPGMVPRGQYWNNGINQQICFDCPGEGWFPGGIGTTNKGMSFWNNGFEQKMSAQCPGEGWSNGLLKGSMNWWTNGIKQVRQKSSPGPEWTTGMLKKSLI
jgi:hypothetical protein